MLVVNPSHLSATSGAHQLNRLTETLSLLDSNALGNEWPHELRPPVYLCEFTFAVLVLFGNRANPIDEDAGEIQVRIHRASNLINLCHGSFHSLCTEEGRRGDNQSQIGCGERLSREGAK